MASGSDYQSLMQDLNALRAVDPLPYLGGLALQQDLADPQLRHLRADALRTLAARLHRGVEVTGLRDELLVRPEGVFIDIDGVLLDVLRSPMYLKATGSRQHNQARRMAGFLQAQGVRVKTMVDVGANVGEISLWFARECPDARIVAIEASSDTREVFALNASMQRFATANVELIAQAVCAKAGPVLLSRGAGPMNRIVAQGGADAAEEVAGDRLDSLFERHGIVGADFVKIDTEGSEPALREAIVALGARVRAYLIEFSKFAPFEDYMALATSLMATGFRCHDDEGSRRLESIPAVQQHLRQVLAPKETLVTNLWFIRPA